MLSHSPRKGRKSHRRAGCRPTGLLLAICGFEPLNRFFLNRFREAFAQVHFASASVCEVYVKHTFFIAWAALPNSPVMCTHAGVLVVGCADSNRTRIIKRYPSYGNASKHTR